jgi:transposase-like protein
MTSKTPIKCPYCGNDKVSKNGHSKAGKQVYNYNNKPAHTKTL